MLQNPSATQKNYFALIRATGRIRQLLALLPEELNHAGDTHPTYVPQKNGKKNPVMLRH